MANPGIGELVAAIQAAPPRCGSTRVILIDGPAGAGKTTLANRLTVALGGTASAGAGTYDPAAPTAQASPVQVLHGDDMYEGWGGLETVDEVLVDQVLSPLARGVAAGFRMWDWIEERRTHEIAVPPRPYLIVEGVGVAQRRARPFASLAVWVEAPWELRLERGMERDGEGMRAEWERWEAVQNAHHAREATRASADAIIDGTAPVPTIRTADVRRLSEATERVDAGRALLEQYFRLPDAWPDGETPPILPEPFRAALESYPAPAAPPGGDAFIAELGGLPIGQVLLARHAEGVARLERAYVAPVARGQGVGRALVEAALARARELGYRRVVLDVLPGREAAIALYRSVGFDAANDFDADGRVCLGLDLALAD